MLTQSNLISNTVSTLDDARQKLQQNLTANLNQTGYFSKLNNSVTSVLDSINKLQQKANEQGIDTTNCTHNLTSDVAKLTVNFTTRLGDCPITIAAKGLQMINDDIAYINNIGNLTAGLPKVIQDCKMKLPCLASVIGKYTVTIGTAPVKIAAMATTATTYASTLQTNLGLCATNASFASIAETTIWGNNMTQCIVSRISNSTQN